MKNIVCAILTILLMAACGADDYTYSSYPCRLILDTATHDKTILPTAMSPFSPGVFCEITLNKAGDALYYKNNQGLSSSSPDRLSEKEKQYNFLLGMNNGIMVGYGYDNIFYAYDKECPNCFNPEAIPIKSKPLTMEGEYAVCSVCKRKYSMTYGGNCVSEGGVKGLTRYRCNTTGPNGILTVVN